MSVISAYKLELRGRKEAAADRKKKVQSSSVQYLPTSGSQGTIQDDLSLPTTITTTTTNIHTPLATSGGGEEVPLLL